MLEFYAGVFCAAAAHLQHLNDDVARAIEVRAGDALITPDEANRMRSVTGMLTQECERVGLNRSIERLGRFLNLKTDTLTLQRLAWELDELWQAIKRDLFARTFIHIPPGADEYLNREALFGPLVNEKFPKAVDDIREAGSCYATGNYTASVFHLMRAVEYGLRALAKKLKVKLPKPVDLTEWGGLLAAIEVEIKKIELSPRTHKRDRDLEFFHGAAAQFRHFKNAWRNHVMHTRSMYDERQAMSVMAHVREFMQHIATRV
jgi:hypothetical protein